MRTVCAEVPSSNPVSPLYYLRLQIPQGFSKSDEEDELCKIHGDNIVSLLHGITVFILLMSRVQINHKLLLHMRYPPF